jgi:tetratricopeptide (TPR) repeat protein
LFDYTNRLPLGALMNKRLNVRLLLRLAALSLLAVLLVHLLHNFQLRRQARSFRARGADALENGDSARAVLYLGRYLALQPADIQGEADFGLALEKLAATPGARLRAYGVLENVLRRDPDNLDVRQTLGALAVRLDRFAAAVQVLEPLRRTEVNQADLEDTLAWCHLGLGQREQASQCFREAIRHRPERLSSYQHLAQLYLDQNDRTAAERVMADMVKANPRQAAAFVARAEFLERLAQFAEAATDLTRAVELAREDVGVLRAAAGFSLRQGRPDQARPLLRHAVAVRGRDVTCVLELAILEHDTGRVPQALAILKDALPGDDPQVIALLGEMLLDRGDCDEAARLGWLVPADSSHAKYLQACRWTHQGEWIKAARALEELVDAFIGAPVWAQRVQLGLARCYGACGDDIRQIEACRRAVSHDAGWRKARLALSRALMATGQHAEACRQWKRLMSDTEPPAEGWTAWARALARSSLRPNSEPVDWREVDSLLEQARRAKVDPVKIALARAEALVLQDRLNDAEQFLLAEVARLGESPALLVALADVLAARGRFREAVGFLKKHTEPESRAALIRYATLGVDRLAKPGAVLDEATHGLDQLPDADAGIVLRALAESRRGHGDLSAALDACRRWCRRSPQDLRAFLMLADLGERLLHLDDLRAAAAGLRSIEGESGLRWRCAEATRMLLARHAPNADGPRLMREARWLLDEAREQGGSTAAGGEKVALLEGRLEDLAGHAVEAVTLYLQAFDLGERGEQQSVYLVRLLLDRQRLLEADRLLRRCEREGMGDAVSPGEARFTLFPPPARTKPLPPALARLGCEAALRQKDRERALELATRAVPADGGSYRDQLWLAGVYETAGRPAEATSVLERLAERSGDVTEVWVALVRHLVRIGQRDRAEDVLPRAQRRLSGVDNLWPLALGRCQQALGKTELAARTYRLALQAAPRNLSVQREVAAFYLAADLPEQAVPLLRSLAAAPVQSRSDAVWAARMLATIPFDLLTLRRPGPQDARLLEDLQEDTLLELLSRAADSQDRIANERALILLRAARKPVRNAALEALTRFEKTLSPIAPLSPDEQYHLAQLYELAGNPTRGDALLDDLLAGDHDNPRYLACRIRLLLGRGDLDSARRVVKFLREVEPDSERTAALLKECDL